MLNAYRRPRFVVEGCNHRLGCKCEPPYWLRDLTPAEEAHEARMLGTNRVKVPSPSAVCGILGCTQQSAHEHVVLS